MFVCKERVIRNDRLVAFEGEEMTDEEAAARGLAVEPEEPQLEELTVAQLREIAEQEGVEVPAKAKKQEIIDAINGEPEEAPEETPGEAPEGDETPEEDLYDDEEDEECE